MAFVHGSDSVITVDATDISAYTDSTDMDQSQDTAEVSAFGDADKAFIAGLKSGSFSLAGHWDSTADSTLAGTFDGATVAIVYGPAGSGTGNQRYTANCFVTSYTQSSPVNGKVSWRASFLRSGALTDDTYP